MLIRSQSRGGDQAKARAGDEVFCLGHDIHLHPGGGRAFGPDEALRPLAATARVVGETEGLADYVGFEHEDRLLFGAGPLGLAFFGGIFSFLV